MLQKLAADVVDSEKRIGKKHEIFRLSFDAKECFSREMVEQKLDYIHGNPVAGKWRLVDDYAYYEHSSASFYELGIQGKVRLKHYREVI